MAPSDNSVSAEFDTLLREYFPRNWVQVREEVAQASTATTGSTKP